MKKILKIVAIPGIILIIVTIISLIFSDGITYEVIRHGEMEKSYSFSAMVIRNETVILSQKSGVLESHVDNGEMIRKNKHIASIYESKIDENTKRTIERINARIDEITKIKDQFSASEIGAYQLDGVMDSKMRDLSDAMEKGDMKEVTALANELNLLNDRKNALQKGADYTEDTLKALLAEKAEAEKELGSSKQDLFSPAAGIYTTDVDGFERLLTPNAIGEMTPYEFDAIKKMNEKDRAKPKANEVCKIIEGTEWSVAFVATEKELSKLKEGSRVYIRAKNHEEDSEARISYISTPVNGNYLVIATSDKDCTWAMKERFVEIDLIRSKHTGLKVPIAALRVKDGKTGVFAVVDGIVYFKEVNVLYKDSVYAIVEEDNTSRGGLLLYDEVVVSSRRELKEGERIS